MTKEVPINSQDTMIIPIDCCRYFITDAIISLMFRETNQYIEQHVET